jgi:hypothetical protein
MKQQLSTLRDLISVLDPQMYAHLGASLLPSPLARLAAVVRLFSVPRVDR